MTEHEIYVRYYVNTADGSIYLPEISLDAAAPYIPGAAATLHDSSVDVQGLIRMSNGQTVWYVNDKENGISRALTMPTYQTSEDVAIRQHNGLEIYLNWVQRIIDGDYDLGDARHEAPTSDLVLRDEEIWGGLRKISGPWAYDREGRAYRVTMQIAKEPSIPRVATGRPLIGFIAGIMKSKRSPCNLLVVETTLEITEDKVISDEGLDRTVVNRGAYLQETITDIGPAPVSFKGSGYKIMTLGSRVSALLPVMSPSEREDFAEKQNALQEQNLLLFQELADCRGNKTCEAEVKRKMMVIQRQMEDAVYFPRGGEYSGNSTDIINKQRALRDQMYVLQEKMLQKEVHCDRLDRMNTNCGGCMDLTVESCKKEYENLQTESDRLECKLAKLNGYGDLFEDCE